MKLLISFFFAVTLLFIRSQNNRYLDSLDGLIYRLKSEDEKIKIITKIFIFFQNERVPEDIFKSYFTRYYNLSKKENSNKILQSLYHQTGGYYYYLFDYKKAEAFLDSAIALGNKFKNEEFLMANYMTRGAIRYTMHEYHSSLADYFESEKRMKTFKPQKLGGLYSNMAMIYTELNELDQSEYYSNLALYHLKGHEEQTYIKVLNNLGLIFKKKNQLNKADSVFRLGLSIAKKTNNLQDVSDILYNLANVLYMKKKFREALDCYNELEKIIVLNKTDNQNWLKMIYAGAAYLNNKLKNKKSTMEFLKKAENLTWHDQTPPEQKFDYYNTMADLYYELNQFKNSADFYRKMNALDIVGKKESEIINVQKIKYQNDRQKDSLAYVKQKEIDDLKNKQFQTEMEFKIKRQKNIIIVSVIFLIIVSLFSVFLVRAIKQKEKANRELSEQKQIVQKKNAEITDSIRYAMRIQQSLLPSEKQIAEILSDFFLLYLPKDIVSGDFYWIKKINADEFFISVGDCTGHGVPGAIMSALSIQQLNELSAHYHEPDEILFRLNNNLKNILQQDQEGRSKDGLDIGLCKANMKTGKLCFSGANRNLWIFKENSELLEVKAEKIGIGGHTPSNQTFQKHELFIDKNSLLVLSTDGYADQFGGEKTKKIGSRKLKELISVFSTQKTDKVRIELENFFIHWKQNNEQTDDVCLLGFKI